MGEAALYVVLRGVCFEGFACLKCPPEGLWSDAGARNQSKRGSVAMPGLFRRVLDGPARGCQGEKRLPRPCSPRKCIQRHEAPIFRPCRGGGQTGGGGAQRSTCGGAKRRNWKGGHDAENGSDNELLSSCVASCGAFTHAARRRLGRAVSRTKWALNFS